MPNTGSFTGLTEGADYVADAVHVDANGNQSAVISSAPFTPAATSSPSGITFVSSDAWDPVSGTGEARTFTGAITSSGFWVVVLGNDDVQSTANTVTMGGTTATLAINTANAGNVEIHYVTNATAGDLVITNQDNRHQTYALYKLDGFTATGLITEIDASASSTLSASLSNVPNGAAVFAGVFLAGASGNSVITATETTETATISLDDRYLTVNTGIKSGTGTVSASAPIGAAAREGMALAAFPAA